MQTKTRKKQTVSSSTKKEAKPAFLLTKNTIALRKGFICVTEEDIVDNRIPVATVQAHLMQYRYMLDEDAFASLAKADMSEIQKFHDEIIAYLKNATGGEGFTPLYKNFPQEVMSKSDYELYWNAIRHYWSNGTWEPTSPVMEKPVQFENIKYNILKVKKEADFLKIFTDLTRVNTSLTPIDLEIIKWFAASGLELKFPEVIPFKENLMTLAAMGLPVPVKTPTDVLRIAVHMSGGDISLPAVPRAKVKQRYVKTLVDNPDREKFKFKKFSRKERKYLLSLLEASNCRPEEMVLKDQRWIRLGEILHPGEYKTQFPKSYDAFRKIRGGEKPPLEKGKSIKKKPKKDKIKVRSWYSNLQRILYRDLDLEGGLKYLSQRPGEFIRRIDWLVRTFTYEGNLTMIMDSFREACKGASNKVLFELYTHFENRANPTSGRSVFVKGARKKTPLPELKALSPDIIEGVHQTIFAALRDKFAKLEPLGNVWIDEDLKKIPLPTNMRTLNPALKPTIRGQRIAFDNPDCKIIRPFIHWNGPVDLDLSATFVRDKKNGQSGLTGYHGTLSFSNLRLNNSYHSGDVRHRHGKCAEYIDIDIQDALNNGYKYVVIDVRNFDGGSTLGRHATKFGFMERQFPESNSAWLPETVINCSDLQAAGAYTTICMIDLQTKEYIMLDMDLKGSTASANAGELIKLVYEYCEPPKVSVYDLLLMHAESRGRLMSLDHNIDTYFKAEDFSNSYETACSYMGV